MHYRILGFLHTTSISFTVYSATLTALYEEPLRLTGLGIGAIVMLGGFITLCTQVRTSLHSVILVE